MTDSNDQERFLDLASGYCLGNLDPDEMEAFQQLLAQDPGLVEQVDELQAVLDLLPCTLSEVSLPATIWQKITAQVQNPSRELPYEKIPRSHSVLFSIFKQGRGWKLFSGIALMSTLVMGGYNYQLRHALVDTQNELQQARNRAIAVNSRSDSAPITTEDLLGRYFQGLNQLLKDYDKASKRKGLATDIDLAQPFQLSQELRQLATLPSPMPLLSANYRLRGGSVCQLGQAKGIRLSYQTVNQVPIAFYQVERRVPADFPLNEQESFALDLTNGANAIFWADNQFFFAVVSELPMDSLQEMRTNLSFLEL